MFLLLVIKMKTISIKQPWASLIINGYKEYEFRSWNTKFRGQVLIHASKTVEKDVLKRFEQLNLDYPTGKIIGSVNITDVIKVNKCFEDKLIKENELIYGATIGREGYAFKIENVEKFKQPIEAKGMLGFWNYEDNDNTEIVRLKDALE